MIYVLYALSMAALFAIIIKRRIKDGPLCDRKQEFYIWGDSVNVTLSEFAGTYRRDRFVRDEKGKIHHFVQYNSRPEDVGSGPGTDMSEIDASRGVKMEEMAERLGCVVR